MKLSSLLVICGLALLVVVELASATSPSDKGCCVYWQNANRALAVQSVEQTREQCFKDAKNIAESAGHFDFYRGRSCSQAERCTDGTCSNLASEPIEPIDDDDETPALDLR